MSTLDENAGTRSAPWSTAGPDAGWKTTDIFLTGSTSHFILNSLNTNRFPQAASPLKPGPGAKVLGGGTPLPTQTIAPQPTVTPAKSNPSQPSLLPKPNIAPTPSPSKTYTIQRNPNVPANPNVTPIQPKPIAPSPQQLTPAPAPIQTPAVNSTPGTPNKQNMVVGIQSLGANTVTIKDGQLIVQGPDHAAATQIAQLLSTGAAKLANLNGKQVLLTTAPAKAGQQTATTPVAPPPRDPTPPPPPREPTPPPPREPSPPPSLTVTAQLAQTPQGPRIILQGLQGVQLEQQQLVAIQQQVKQQLLKQQSIARQQGKVPPTKVTFQLSGPMIKKDLAPAVNQSPVQEPPAPPPQPQLKKDIAKKRAQLEKQNGASNLPLLPELGVLNNNEDRARESPIKTTKPPISKPTPLQNFRARQKAREIYVHSRIKELKADNPRIEARVLSLQQQVAQYEPIFAAHVGSQPQAPVD